MMCSPALWDPEFCLISSSHPPTLVTCLAPQEQPIYASWIASLNHWLIFTNWLLLTGMCWLTPSSWHLTCIHIYWVSCSYQRPLTDTYPGPSPTASARAPSLLNENRQEETVSDSPSTRLFLVSDTPTSLPLYPTSSVPLSLVRGWLSLCLCDPVLSPTLCLPLRALSLWLFYLPPLSPPT